MALELPVANGLLFYHQLLVQDQRHVEELLLRRACVAGFSMSPPERLMLTKFLSEMCNVFRGVEAEWLKVDGTLHRHELRYCGDGVFNAQHRLVLDAIEEKKRQVVAIFGPAGCGKSCFIARIAAYARTSAAAAYRKLKDDAEAATKKGKKKPAVAAAAAAKPAAAGAAVKKKEAADVVPPAQTRVLVYFKNPWDSFKDVLLFLAQEVWGPVAAAPPPEKLEELRYKDAEMRHKLSVCPPGSEVAVFCEGLELFFSMGLNQTLGFVLDGLTEALVNKFADALKALKDASRGIKLWCVVSVCTASEDELFEGRKVIQTVKMPLLSRPEATALLFSAVREFGPHLLHKPISLFMRVFKGQSGNPRYLRALAQLVSAWPLPNSLTGDIDALQLHLCSLYLHDLLPFLEREFNPNGALFPGVSHFLKRHAVLGGSAGTEMQAVHRLVRLLYEAGERGVFVSDVPALMATEAGDVGLADCVLFPLIELLRPHLHSVNCYGEERVALVCPEFLDAVRKRYWPSALIARGTGCQQTTSRLRPLVGPLRAAFGKSPGAAPLIIIDIVDTQRLDTVKRLVTRFLLGWCKHPLKGAAGSEELSSILGVNDTGFAQFNILSCQSDAQAFSESLVQVDANGSQVMAAAAWLAKLGTPLVGGLGIQEKEKKKEDGLSQSAIPLQRVEWTAAIEHVAQVGRGCDKMYIISDRTPTLSVERILDEVTQLNDEMGHGWQAMIDCVSLDSEPVAARMLRRISSATNGKYSRVSAFTLRQQLFWDWMPVDDKSPMSPLAAAEMSCNCLQPLGPAYVPLLAARRQEQERTGSAGHELLVESGRSVVLVLNGEGESHVGGVSGARTQRGLRLTVFNRDWTEKINRTYDTWGSISQANALARQLSKCTPNETVVITSFDAWERCFNHPLAQELSRCGIEGRTMLKHTEQAKASWETLVKDLGWDPGDDARPQGHGHPVAAIGIPGRKPWGRTVVIDDLSQFSEGADLSVSLDEIARARQKVQEQESTETVGRAVGVCKVVTPMRWNHEAGSGAAYNTLPGHAFTSPSTKTKDGLLERPAARSLNSVLE